MYTTRLTVITDVLPDIRQLSLSLPFPPRRTSSNPIILIAMADPYNPYTSYSTPTPGGISYYPPAPDEQPQSHQPTEGAYPYQPSPYSNVDYGGGAPPPDQNYAYAPQSSTSQLQPEGYSNIGAERSYTPIGQPDYLGPVSAPEISSHGTGKVPENSGY